MEATKENVKALQQLAASSEHNEEQINDLKNEKLYLNRDITAKILPFILTNDTELTEDNCPRRITMKDVKLKYQGPRDYQVNYAWYIFNIDDEIVYSKKIVK